MPKKMWKIRIVPYEWHIAAETEQTALDFFNECIYTGREEYYEKATKEDITRFPYYDAEEKKVIR